MDQDNAPERAEDIELSGNDHQRVEHDLIRNKRADDQNRKEHFGTFEAPIGEGIAIHGGDNNGNDYGWNGDLNRIPEANLQTFTIEPCARRFEC